MRLWRTANAGCLLELDGCRILLDGVCREVAPYPATPQHLRQQLIQCFPDLVAVTHRHEDHCDPAFEQQYTLKTGRPVLYPSPERAVYTCGGVTVTALPGRHIGKSDCDHVSYILQGSRCVWFMGDAAPAQWKNRTDLPAPDVLIAPYAYANTPSTWSQVEKLAPKAVVILHLPEPAQDVYGLGQAVRQTVGQGSGISVFIPAVEEFVDLVF